MVVQRLAFAVVQRILGPVGLGLLSRAIRHQINRAWTTPIDQVA
jgi:hypothetical protein